MVQKIFSFGQQAPEDDRCYGCPVKAVTVGNIVKAKSLIKEDLRITHEEIQDALGISWANVNNFLLDHLSIQKRCTHWIPHNLTKQKKRIMLTKWREQQNLWVKMY